MIGSGGGRAGVRLVSLCSWEAALPVLTSTPRPGPLWCGIDVQRQAGLPLDDLTLTVPVSWLHLLCTGEETKAEQSAWLVQGHTVNGAPLGGRPGHLLPSLLSLRLQQGDG